MKILFFKKNLSNLYNYHPLLRKSLLLIADILIIFISFYILQEFLLPETFLDNGQNTFLFVNALIGLFIYTKFGQYQSLTKYFKNKILFEIAIRNFSILLTTNFLFWFVKILQQNI